MSTGAHLGFEQESVGGRPGASSLAELSRVRTVSPVRVGKDELPAGSQGTIVHAYRGHPAYEVEFTTPIHAVLTLSADQIRPSRD